jgi:tRNA-splicing ligase RtcB
MSAVPLKLDAGQVRAHAAEIHEAIRRTIPMGVGKQHQDVEIDEDVEARLNPDRLTAATRELVEAKGWRSQIGTLGSGNHFIEVGADEHGEVWVIVHSGSRGVGHAIATHHMKKASGGGKAREGNWGFPVDSHAGQAYLNDMAWALDFALANREAMVGDVVGVILDRVGGDWKTVCMWDRFINRHHNHATERDGLWIHRKGATHAEAGMMGVIPGNMRDGSFIVRGKGNPDSLWSSSHGAGRVLGRKEAKRQLDLEAFKAQMVGIASCAGEHTLDEAPGAYKSIFEVMRLQADLLDVVAHVRPIVNVKG